MHFFFEFVTTAVICSRSWSKTSSNVFVSLAFSRRDLKQDRYTCTSLRVFFFSWYTGGEGGGKSNGRRIESHMSKQYEVLYFEGQEFRVRSRFDQGSTHASHDLCLQNIDGTPSSYANVLLFTKTKEILFSSWEFDLLYGV